MRILYLSYYYKPDITAAAFRSTDFVEFLLQKGIDIRVITSYPHKLQNVHEENETDDGKVAKIRLRAMKNSRFLSYILHYLSYVPRSLSRALGWRFKGWKPDLIFISSPPIFVGISGILLKFFFRAKMVTEIRDIWPDSAVAAGQIHETGMAFKISTWFERFLYRRSNGLVCVSKPMKEYLQRYFKNPICVAYNGPKENTINEVAAVEHLERGNSIRMAYAGNLGLVQGMDKLILAFQSLKNYQTKFKWKLEIYGTGAIHDNLIALVDKLNLTDQIKFHGAVSKKELNKRLMQMDVLYLGLIKARALDKTIPSKLFDYLSFGKPILAALTGEGKEILNITGGNVIVDDCDPEKIVKGLLRMEENIVTFKELAIKNKTLLYNKFTREVNNEKVLIYIQQLTDN